MYFHWWEKTLVRIIGKYCRSISTTTMAKSKFEYVKQFERENFCLPNCWMVVRIDGKNFSKFTDAHEFNKPNDIRALDLMNQAAITVMNEFRDILLAFGQSDEYSFIFRKDTQLYSRRESKLISYVNSLFSSAYVFNWSKYFGDVPLKYPPSFDARIVLYPSDKNLRDYLSWRQADVHVNNLYNTCFWNLVQKKNMTCSEAQKALKGTLSGFKNELLFQDFGINYNNEPQIFRKGTTLIRKVLVGDNDKKIQKVVPIHEDIIGDQFWEKNPELLAEKPSTTSQTKLQKLKNAKNTNDNDTISVRVGIVSDD